ncbi:bifunctional cytochrome P450/NADPH--P450 reductase [Aspergillus mulundensis]|uniref:Bifunctional cytochrome P450/NADPH--P450 reductase n=1 Tax=Aspergillus mulundensis TaxID=1810919 RepID=A0A3D8SU18_9EURO|nr:Bifunctional cytochrome P450 reductase [Aspergillus mulundensis]RDW89799.1 Bifunctional cytochrome P450 reductase [Aspergillus mulundensis]
MAEENTVEIPEPSGLPFLGNIGTIDQEFPLGSMVSLAEQHGEIYRLRFPGRTVVIVSTHALVDETCDEKRFKKSVNSALAHVRDGVHDGLFTAKMGEENWGIAHRVLMPAFGPLSIRGMYDEMHDIASQLALKWARYGPDSPIMVTDDFTRLTLDTLALCSMGYRFNSYYSPELHPFVEAMGDFLTEAGEKPRRPPLPAMFFRGRDEKFANDIAVLRDTAQGVLQARKEGKSHDRNDLLAAMLRGVDSQTGKKMTDESIMDNLITFLIAGHETTSGLLSFVFYQLLTHPKTYRKAQQEVDEVVGQGVIEVSHLSKLPYINAVLRETLRLNATIPLFTVEAFEDTLLAGKFPVKAGETIVNLLAKSHLDPEIYGDDATEFKPERMSDELFNARQKQYPNSWKPFGNGMRACIGRPFAWQEALLVMAMLLQNFDFSFADAEYDLKFKQTLTIKPKDLYMKATLRHGLTPTTLERRLAGLAAETTTQTKTVNADSADTSSATGAQMTILYGSNSGTCETLARRIAADAPSKGFHVTRFDGLDSGRAALPTDHPVVIVTSSYEGQPPDNAKQFVSWLEDLDKQDEPSPLKDVPFAVFGCGNKEWAQTFHRIPKLVDNLLNKLGGTRITDLGLADVSTDELFSTFEAWADDVLWPRVVEQFGAEGRKSQDQNESPDRKASAAPAPGVEVTVSNSRTQALRQDVGQAMVVETRLLTAEEEKERRKKHLEIRLPEGVTYTAGDYLAVLPINPAETVRRAMRQFKLPWDAQISIASSGPTTTALPTDGPVAANEILSTYVELAQPATRKDLRVMADAATDPNTQKTLRTYANETETYKAEILAESVSVLDILERHPDIDLPLGSFLLMLPSMRMRQYSISSSPLSTPTTATITISVLDAPSRSRSNGRYLGVATSYLDSLSAGDHLQVSIRKNPSSGFRLPTNPTNTPMICIAAGSGIAPFRAFLQERAHLQEKGTKLAPALLFFGCRAPGVDDLYREQLDEWAGRGVVDVRWAFSRKAEESNGCAHVDDRIWADREDVRGLWSDGARVYVCGSGAVARSVRGAMVRIIREDIEKKADVGVGDGADGETADSEKRAEKWFDEQRNVRYVMEVFD